MNLAESVLDLPDVRRHQCLKSSDDICHLARVLLPELLTLLLQLLDLGPVAPLQTIAHLRVLVQQFEYIFMVLPQREVLLGVAQAF